jgi:hypothetical protein
MKRAESETKTSSMKLVTKLKMKVRGGEKE